MTIRSRNTIIAIAALWALAAAAAAGWKLTRSADPPAPDLSLKTGGGAPSAEFRNAQQAVDHYRDLINKQPGHVEPYVELAELFLQEARITGQHQLYFPKAEYLLNRALMIDPRNEGANLARASMLLSMHRFEEAREIALRVAAANPHGAFAWGVLCDASVELGNYGDAVAACDSMLKRRPDLRSYARASYLREIHGDIPGALAAMRLAADAGMAGEENRAWTLYSLGKLYLNEGRIDTAAYIFNGILEERPDYAWALSGLAQVARARGEWGNAEALLTRASQLAPEHLFLEQLADVYLESGNTEAAAGLSKIVLKMFGQHEEGGWNVNREAAMFSADHGINIGEALRRAGEEAARRPGNVDVLDTFSWVLYKSGRAREAAAYAGKAVAISPRNFALLARASAICEAAGLHDRALDLARRSREENSYGGMLLVNVPAPAATTIASKEN